MSDVHTRPVALLIGEEASGLPETVESAARRRRVNKHPGSDREPQRCCSCRDSHLRTQQTQRGPRATGPFNLPPTMDSRRPRLDEALGRVHPNGSGEQTALEDLERVETGSSGEGLGSVGSVRRSMGQLDP